MKTKIIGFVLCLVVFAFAGIGFATASVAISPNGDNGEFVKSCPTFEWSPDEGAVSYELAVFELRTQIVPAYEVMATMAKPVITEKIIASALSWTPPPSQCLNTENVYVWYVKGIDGNGKGVWAEGKKFIAGVTADSRPPTEEQRPDVDTAKEYANDQIELNGAEEANNTYYGNGAGELNTGTGNCFFGYGAGFRNSGDRNTFVGNQAGIANYYGDDNTFVGFEAGLMNTTYQYMPSQTGYRNTFVGSYAGHENDIGCDNSFFGYSTGEFNTTGGDNSFFGNMAGNNNKTGYGNTYVGSEAGLSNENGIGNTCVGTDAGYTNTGVENTFIGYTAGKMNTTGYGNSFFGSHAGLFNTTASQNTFVGYNAGYNNTDGNKNTFNGWSAGHENTTGAGNTFTGESAGYNNKTGHGNTFFGAGAGRLNSGGGYNTFLGYRAGDENTAGSDNVFIGDNAGFHNTGSGNVFLGNEAGKSVNAFNTLIIDNSDAQYPLIFGDFSTNKVIIFGGFTSIASHSSSDERWKKNIEPLESSLERISNLQGVSFEWKTDEYPDMGMTEGKQIGLIAQDVEKELPELVSEDKDGYKAVSYTKLTAVLVEAVKELKAENQRQKKLLEGQRIQFQKQQTEIEALRSMIKDLKS